MIEALILSAALSCTPPAPTPRPIFQRRRVVHVERTGRWRPLARVFGRVNVERKRAVTISRRSCRS
jgi:hypothetical protein